MGDESVTSSKSTPCHDDRGQYLSHTNAQTLSKLEVGHITLIVSLISLHFSGRRYCVSLQLHWDSRQHAARIDATTTGARSQLNCLAFDLSTTKISGSRYGGLVGGAVVRQGS